MSTSPNGTDLFHLLPPIDEYNLVGIMVATLIYGANALLYVSCMYILTRRSSSGMVQWPLLITSTILFSLASLHIGSSLQQLREAFIQAPRTSIPAASLLYWATVTTPAGRLHSYSYPLLDTVQDTILIWRLYVVWGKRWKVVLAPVILEFCHTAFALYDTAHSLKPGSSNDPQSAINVIALSFLASVNLSTTIGIAGRLWYLGRSSAIIRSYTSTRSSTNKYMAPILTVVESGAIFTSSMICLLIFIILDSSLLVLMISISAQLAAFTPFLIVVRVGFGFTHGTGAQPKAADTSIQFRTTNESKSTATAVKSNVTRAGSSSMNETDEYPLEDMTTDLESGKEPSLKNNGAQDIFIVDINSSSHRVARKNATSTG